MARNAVLKGKALVRALPLMSTLHATIVALLEPALPGGAAAPSLDLLDLILRASVVVKIVLLLLIGMSVACWYIIAHKWFFLRRAQHESLLFLETFWQTRRLEVIYKASEQHARSPISQMFRAGYNELSKIKGAAEVGQGQGAEELVVTEGALENVERALRRSAQSEVTQLENGVPFLATTGSTAPFVGLFGTVWGIMDAFIKIHADQQASLPSVAPGIAEALIATAIGLVAAIPAVMAYNLFLRKIRVLSSEMEAFSNDFLNIVKRHFLK